jgi:hypothetical protein
MSKSKIPVGGSEQHAFGMSTTPEMRPSIGADPSAGSLLSRVAELLQY